MGRRTTIILNDKLFTKLLKIQSEKILELNASISLSSIINRLIEEKILDHDVKKPSKKIPGGSDVILEKIAEMQNYDHLAFAVRNNNDFGNHLSEFIMQGLKMNLLNVMIVSEREAQKYVELLKQNGINALDLINSQDIIILSHEEIFGKVKFGTIEPILKRVGKLTSIVKAKKKSGMNVIGTIAGTLASTGQHEQCIKLEKIWHESIPKFEVPIRVVCPYHTPISSEIVDSLVLNHTDDFVR